MRYKDRTGKEVCANGQQDALLQKLYGTALGRKLLSVLVQPVVSKIAGRFMDSGLSAVLVSPFVQKNHIDLSQYEKQEFTSYNLVTTIEHSVMQYGIELVIVDNLMTALDVDMASDEYRCQSKFVKKLSRLAKRLDVVVILVAHPRKNSFTSDENDAVSGSADITNAADIVMTFKRDEDTPDHNYLSLSKNRWFGNLTKKDGIDLWYDQRSRRIIDRSKKDFFYETGWKVEPEQQNFDGFFNMPDDMENPFEK